MAPEIFNGEKYTEKADVYSFGIVMWEIFTRKFPFSGVEPFSIPVQVSKGERPPIPKDMNQSLSTIIKAAWGPK